jgi:fumarylpyruvate hydrolase
LSYLFEPVVASAEIAGGDARYPVHRVYCVGRNYAEHAREMGADEREPPFFFMKPADAVVPGGGEIPYPSATENLHYEMELVIAIGTAGASIAKEQALDHIWGYGVGIDLTRRDLQLEARNRGRPWDAGKGFDRSAPVSALRPVSEIGHPGTGRIWLDVNDERRQDSDISHMIWNVPEIIVALSGLYALAPGDLIFTGTPAGVGAIVRGDVVKGGVDGVDEIRIKLV